MSTPATSTLPVLQSLVPAAAVCEDDVCILPGAAEQHLVNARLDDDRV